MNPSRRSFGDEWWLFAVGAGTHDELLTSCQEYAEIVESQHAAQEAELA